MIDRATKLTFDKVIVMCVGNAEFYNVAILHLKPILIDPR